VVLVRDVDDPQADRSRFRSFVALPVLLPIR
jgi:hypothetical protein